VIGMSAGVYGVSNLVSNVDQPVLSMPSLWKGDDIDLVVNARVAVSPEELEVVVRSALSTEAASVDATAQILALQCFRPGKPVPTHRLES